MALGNFDGVHLGHRSLIARAVDVAKAMDAMPCVWAFATHPALFLGKNHPGLLMQREQKSRLLSSLGIQREIHADFAAERHRSPEEFVQKVLLEQLNATHVVCGFNYTFGNKGLGTAGLLSQLLWERGIGLSVVDPVTYEGSVVSSSRIRKLLREGDLVRANAMLGSPLALSAPVEKGKRLGRTLGFPTANQSVPADFVRMKRGVYATRVEVEGVCYPAITNVGVRPTVEGEGVPNCESHLLGFSGDLYEKQITCHFLRFLREERRFASISELKAQVDQDIKEVEGYFEG